MPRAFQSLPAVDKTFDKVAKTVEGSLERRDRHRVR
jgi:hypothetical protein